MLFQHSQTVQTFIHSFYSPLTSCRNLSYSSCDTTKLEEAIAAVAANAFSEKDGAVDIPCCGLIAMLVILHHWNTLGMQWVFQLEYHCRWNTLEIPSSLWDGCRFLRKLTPAASVLAGTGYDCTKGYQPLRSSARSASFHPSTIPESSASFVFSFFRTSFHSTCPAFVTYPWPQVKPKR